MISIYDSQGDKVMEVTPDEFRKFGLTEPGYSVRFTYNNKIRIGFVVNVERDVVILKLKNDDGFEAFIISKIETPQPFFTTIKEYKEYLFN